MSTKSNVLISAAVALAISLLVSVGSMFALRGFVLSPDYIPEIDGSAVEDPMNDPPGQICGNGVIEGDEECDDGNIADGDGCTFDCLTELEPVGEAKGVCCITAAAGNRSCLHASGASDCNTDNGEEFHEGMSCSDDPCGIETEEEMEEEMLLGAEGDVCTSGDECNEGLDCMDGVCAPAAGDEEEMVEESMEEVVAEEGQVIEEAIEESDTMEEEEATE